MQTLTNGKNYAVCIAMYYHFCRRSVLDAYAGTGKA